MKKLSIREIQKIQICEISEAMLSDLSLMSNKIPINLSVQVPPNIETNSALKTCEEGVILLDFLVQWRDRKKWTFLRALEGCRTTQAPSGEMEE